LKQADASGAEERQKWKRGRGGEEARKRKWRRGVC